MIFQIPIIYVVIYLVAINILGLFVMFIDKYKAKKGSWRIKEKTLFYFTLMGGGIGTTAGMYIFRHKTKKLRFSIMFPVLTIVEYILIIYVIIKYIKW